MGTIKLTDVGKVQMYDKYKTHWAEGIVCHLFAESKEVEGKKVYTLPISYLEPSVIASDGFCYGLPIENILHALNRQLSGYYFRNRLLPEKGVDKKEWYIYSARKSVSVYLGKESLDESIKRMLRQGFSDELYSGEVEGKVIRAFWDFEIERSLRGLLIEDLPLAILIYNGEEEFCQRSEDNYDLFQFLCNPRDALVGVIKFETTEKVNAEEGK